MLGDSFYTYFIQDQARTRKFWISGIYSSNFIEYDNVSLLTDMRQLQALNDWDSTYFSGLEVLIMDLNHIAEIGDAVYDATTNKLYIKENTYTTLTINPHIFSWLELLDMSVWAILKLMLPVAGFNIISGLLILILERTNMICILKSGVASNGSMRKDIPL